MKYMGLIIGLEENRAVVMSAESKVIGIKKREGMFLGQKVFYSHNDILAVKRRRTNYYIPAIAGVAALLIFFIGYLKFFNSIETFVFIDVDINPSIEFSVDGKRVVRDVRPINNDASLLIENLDLENIAFEEALKKYIDKAIEEGYLNERKENSNYLLVSAALNSKSNEFKKSRANTEKRLDSELEHLKDNLLEVYRQKFNFEIVKVPEYYKEKSNEKEISLGKYMIYEKIREKGMSITIEEIKSGNLFGLLEKNGLYPLDPQSISTLPETTPVKVHKTIAQYSPVIQTHRVSSNTPVVVNTPTITETLAIMNTPVVSNTPRPQFTSEAKKVRATPNKNETPVNNITPTVASKPTQIIIPSYKSKEADTAQYNFENGFQSFKTSYATEFYDSSEKSYAGSKCLKVKMKPGNDEYIATSNVDPSIKHGTTILFHIWIPDTTEIRAVEPFYQNADWEWTGSWNFYTQLIPNSWNTIKLKILDDEKLPVRCLGVKIAARDRQFSGNVYIDSISWD